MNISILALVITDLFILLNSRKSRVFRKYQCAIPMLLIYNTSKTTCFTCKFNYLFIYDKKKIILKKKDEIIKNYSNKILKLKI